MFSVKADTQNRIVVPKELRKICGFTEPTKVAICIEKVGTNRFFLRQFSNSSECKIVDIKQFDENGRLFLPSQYFTKGQLFVIYAQSGELYIEKVQNENLWQYRGFHFLCIIYCFPSIWFLTLFAFFLILWIAVSTDFTLLFVSLAISL